MFSEHQIPTYVVETSTIGSMNEQKAPMIQNYNALMMAALIYLCLTWMMDGSDNR